MDWWIDTFSRYRSHFSTKCNWADSVLWCCYRAIVLCRCRRRPNLSWNDLHVSVKPNQNFKLMLPKKLYKLLSQGMKQVMALQGILITNISNKAAVALSWQESHRFGKRLKSKLHRLITQRLAVFPSNKIMMCLMCRPQCNICNYNPSIQDEGNTCFLLNTCTFCESHWSLKSCCLRAGAQ